MKRLTSDNKVTARGINPALYRHACRLALDLGITVNSVLVEIMESGLRRWIVEAERKLASRQPGPPDEDDDSAELAHEERQAYWEREIAKISEE